MKGHTPGYLRTTTSGRQHRFPAPGLQIVLTVRCGVADGTGIGCHPGEARLPVSLDRSTLEKVISWPMTTQGIHTGLPRAAAPAGDAGHEVLGPTHC